MSVKTDNSMVGIKIALRKKFLPDNSSVLDCFCGNGSMYRGAYAGIVNYYHGLDSTKIHTDGICTLTDNERWIRENDISMFNVFDLDAYGCPWKLLFLICKKLTAGKFVFFITDGLVLRNKRSSNPSKFLSATEQLPRGFAIPCLNHWYVPVFMTMLSVLSDKYSVDILRAFWLKNTKDTVYYWAVEISKK